MDYTILIIASLVWFFVSATIFKRKLIKKYTVNLKERITIFYKQIPFVLFIKRDKDLTPWVIQSWISFILFLAFFILINYK